MFKDRRIREAIGLAFDFEWTNQNIMFGLYRRLHSFFENSDMKAVGPPGSEELRLLEPFRGKVPDEVFGEPYVPPVSDGSGSDRNLLRRADELLREAGCKREGTVLKLPDGKPFEIEFLDFQASLQPHTQPFQANLKRLGIEARSRIVDAAQYRRRMEDFDFDMASMALGGAMTPGDALRIVFASQAATTPGSRNIAGIADPAVDALIGEIAQADSRAKLNVAARALDRLLRAGRYMIPMWFRSEEWRRLLGHVLAARDAAEIRVRRAGDLVVRRREGESDREGVIVKTQPRSSSPGLTRGPRSEERYASDRHGRVDRGHDDEGRCP